MAPFPALAFALLAAAPTPQEIAPIHLEHGAEAAATARALARLAADLPGCNGIAWRPAATELEAAATPRVVFVQGGSATARIERTGAAADPTPPRSELGLGDLVLLRPGEGLRADAPLDLLSFALAAPLPDALPPFLRPDHDPRITDTPGGCATEAGAYRRVALTWDERNGSYLYRGLNAHRVRIRDSFTHYHPVAGGFDELYLVQDALPGAELIVGERLAGLLDPSALAPAAAAGLLRRIPVRAGDLVHLPRGTVHRGHGGILAQVIALPGFVPGAEIGVDDAIRTVNARFGLELPWHAEGAPFVAVLERADRVRLETGDALFSEYLFADRPRACFFPVLAPDGRPLTRGWPLAPRAGEEHDHPHHTSLWFAHGDVDGIDFWTRHDVEQRLVAIEDVFSGGGSGGFAARHEWLAPDGRVVLRDRRVFRIHARAATAAAPAERWLDCDITLQAPAERAVHLGDTKEGTMALRLAASLRVDGRLATGTILDSAGRVDGDAWGQRAAWLLVNGRVDEAPAALAILEHPANFRHPTWWHARTYGLLAANPFGAHDFAGAPPGSGDFELAAGAELRLRYRFVFAGAALSAERVAEIAAAWARAAD